MTRSLVRSPFPVIEFPVIEAATVPVVTGAQMRELDRLMVEVMGIGLLQMMENAGRSLAETAVGRFGASSVTVLAGRGNNGGGGLPGIWPTAASTSPWPWPAVSPQRPAPPGGNCESCGRWACPCPAIRDSPHW